MEPELVSTVENFLKLVKGANNKEEYLLRAREFDQRQKRFIDSYPSPTTQPHPQIPKANTHRPSSPPKNPFITPMEEKYRHQPIHPAEMNQSRPIVPQFRKTSNSQLVHTRSQQNFYRGEMQPQYGRELEQLQGNFVQQMTMEDRNAMMDRSFPYESAKGKNNWNDRSFDRPPNQNEFLAGLQPEEPEYVKYYKKMIPTPKPQTPMYPARVNPFKS